MNLKYAKSKFRPPSHRRRSGTATAELSLCLPLVVALVFGSVEATYAVYLQNAITCAAYEAANACSAPDGTSTVAQTRGTAILTALGVHGGSITFSPATVNATTAGGTSITVKCSAPVPTYSLMVRFIGDTTLSATVITQRF